MSYVKAKCTQFDFGWGCASDFAGELTALPRLLAGFNGSCLLREGERGKEKGGRGGRGKGEKRRRVVSWIFGGWTPTGEGREGICLG